MGPNDRWLRAGALFAAAGPAQASPDPLWIEHISDIFEEIGAINDQIMSAHRRASELCPKTHRAGADSRWIWALTAILLRKGDADRGQRTRALTDILWNTPARSLSLPRPTMRLSPLRKPLFL